MAANCSWQQTVRVDNWNFGIYDPVSKVGYVEMVPNCSTQTLRRVVLPGTEIWSDEWRAYRMIGQMGTQDSEP